MLPVMALPLSLGLTILVPSYASQAVPVNVTLRRTVPVKAEVLWLVVSEFENATYLGIPKAKYTTMGGNIVGAVRTLTHMGPPIMEQLVERSSALMRFRTRMIDGPDGYFASGPLPLSKYEVTVTLTAADMSTNTTVDVFMEGGFTDGSMLAGGPLACFSTKEGLEAEFSTSYHRMIDAAVKLASSTPGKIDVKAGMHWPVFTTFQRYAEL